MAPARSDHSLESSYQRVPLQSDVCTHTRLERNGTRGSLYFIHEILHVKDFSWICSCRSSTTMHDVMQREKSPYRDEPRSISFFLISRDPRISRPRSGPFANERLCPGIPDRNWLKPEAVGCKTVWWGRCVSKESLYFQRNQASVDIHYYFKITIKYFITVHVRRKSTKTKTKGRSTPWNYVVIRSRISSCNTHNHGDTR